MNGFLVLAALGQWNWYVDLLYVPDNKALLAGILVDSNDYPVLILKKSPEMEWICFWWKDTAWSVDTLPSLIGEGACGRALGALWARTTSSG